MRFSSRVKGIPQAMSSPRTIAVSLFLAWLFAFHVAPRADAQQSPAVLKGIQFLRSRAANNQVGETGLIALAMLKAEVPPSDPALAACISKLRSRFVSGGYDPERRGGHDNYEAAVVAMALANLDADSRRVELSAVAQYLVSQQKANGSWDYAARSTGDTSIAQYAILGLWEAENGGATVAPEVWDRAAAWFMSTQSAGGSWNYHRDEGQYNDTISMTAAGVGSLLICQRQLARHRLRSEASNLLTPLSSEPQHTKYDPSTPPAQVQQAIRRGLAWLSANFTTTNSALIGDSPFYCLYGIERVGALADKDSLGRVDWFDQGRRYVESKQRGDGAWDGRHNDIPNTAWAILFLTKSTAKTILRVQRKSLGAGTLLGGRGLPKDLTSLTVAGGRVVSRPMSGAIEGMLAALEDPRAENADAALSGLVNRYRAEGPSALKPHKDRFRKLLLDRDPGLRKVAAWSLARTTDLDVVPSLIDALNDPDESVAGIARDGLQLLSRKIKGLGPAPHASTEERAAAANRWRAWYATIRPLDLEGQDDAEPPPPTAPARSRNP